MQSRIKQAVTESSVHIKLSDDLAITYYDLIGSFQSDQNRNTDLSFHSLAHLLLVFSSKKGSLSMANIYAEAATFEVASILQNQCHQS